MSLLGFDKIISKIPLIEKEFLREGIVVARQEFEQNFDTESDAEKNKPWAPVRREVPPPILVESGRFKEQAVSKGIVRYSKNYAVLIIDPIDERGRGYAQYHQDGIGVIERSPITQSESLDIKQRQILLSACDKIFQ